MLTRNAADAVAAFRDGERFVIFQGDCRALAEELPTGELDLVVTSPPYFMGKSYDRSYSLDDFREDHAALIPRICNAVSENGSVCWQVGHHVMRNVVFPLDYAVFECFLAQPEMSLRNRIMWHFRHGVHCNRRFSGRYETILWYTKGDNYYFDLDTVRVPQKYPGKRYYKGPKKGQYSGNPLGKNPSDVWDIPNVKANHVEKTDHPCQFPVALVERLVLSLTKENGAVFDPFCGSASAGVAAILNNRRFLGAEIDPAFAAISEERLQATARGEAKVRQLDRPIWEPLPTDAVACAPAHFRQARSNTEEPN